MKCIECAIPLEDKVFSYSLSHFKYPLCRTHQDFFKNARSTDLTKRLYLALKNSGIPAELEKWDGHKHVDIVAGKINIEVDGSQHNLSPKQAFSDLQRTYYSFLSGIFTLRIPNSLLVEDFETVVIMIGGFYEESLKK